MQEQHVRQGLQHPSSQKPQPKGKKRKRNNQLIARKRDEKIQQIIDTEKNKETKLLKLSRNPLSLFTWRGLHGTDLFHKAAEFGWIDLLIYFVKNRVSPNRIDEYGYTPLAFAVIMGQVEVVKLFRQNLHTCENPSPFEWISNHGQNLLHLAAASGNVQMLTLLIDYKFSLTQPDREYGIPLSIAIYKNHEDAFKFLGALDPSTLTWYERFYPSPLSIAAEQDRLNFFEFLHKNYNHEMHIYNLLIAIIYTDRKGIDYTVLSLLVKSGSLKVIKFFFDNGYFNTIHCEDAFKWRDNIEGATLMHLAFKRAKPETIINLMQFNLSFLESQDYTGRSPLIYAFDHRNEILCQDFHCLMVFVIQNYPELLNTLKEKNLRDAAEKCFPNQRFEKNDDIILKFVPNFRLQKKTSIPFFPPSRPSPLSQDGLVLPVCGHSCCIPQVPPSSILPPPSIPLSGMQKEVKSAFQPPPSQEISQVAPPKSQAPAPTLTASRSPSFN